MGVFRSKGKRWVTVFFSAQISIAGSILSSTAGAEQNGLRGKVRDPLWGNMHGPLFLQMTMLSRFAWEHVAKLQA